MTKKDFIALAAALASTKPALDRPCALATWNKTVTAVIKACATSNPSFNPEAFRAACNGEVK